MAKTPPKKTLGRGLSALIPGADMEFLSRVARGEAASAPVEALETPVEAGDDAPAGTPALVEWIDVTAIAPNPFQPRRFFSPQEMEELAASVREHGVLQPVLVRPWPGDEAGEHPPYQLIAGERRWRAAQAAGLSQVPAVVRAVEDQQALELALIENVQRHDIGPLDTAIAYKRLATEFSLSQEEVARRVGKSRPSVANTMRLLELPVEVQKAIEDGTLSEGHGRAILLASTEGARRAVLRHVLREGLSVRATEDLARNTVDDAGNAPKKSGKRITNGGPEIRALEEKLQKALGTRVALKPRAKGGQIVIEYFNEDDLDRLLEGLTSLGK